MQLAENIYEMTRSVLQKSQLDGISSLTAANQLAEERIQAMEKIKGHR
jgi:hypothetical protein